MRKLVACSKRSSRASSVMPSHIRSMPSARQSPVWMWYMHLRDRAAHCTGLVVKCRFLLVVIRIWETFSTYEHYSRRLADSGGSHPVNWFTTGGWTLVDVTSIQIYAALLRFMSYLFPIIILVLFPNITNKQRTYLRLSVCLSDGWLLYYEWLIIPRYL